MASVYEIAKSINKLIYYRQIVRRTHPTLAVILSTSRIMSFSMGQHDTCSSIGTLSHLTYKCVKSHIPYLSILL